MDRRSFMKLSGLPCFGVLGFSGFAKRITKTNPPPNSGARRRSGTKFMFAEPEAEDMEIVSMTEFENQIYVATKKGVYLIKGNKLERLKMVLKDDNQD